MGKHALIQRRVHHAVHLGAAFEVFLGEHLPLTVDQRQHRALVVGDDQLGAMAHGGDAFGDGGLQRLQSLALPGRDQNRVGGLRDGAGPDRVGLVQHLENGTVARAQFVQHLENRGALLGVIGAGQVGDHQQQVGEHGLLQRGAKGLNQLMGELADEAHGVHQQAAAVVGQIDIAHHRVQRGEQLVLHQHVRAGQRVEQRGFAGVGIAHQRDGGLALLFPAGAAQIPVALELLQIALQIVDALADAPAIHLQTRFAGAAGADAAAQTGHGRALTGQPGQAILHLRQLHLQLALGGLGALGEDVQNQRRAVDDLHAQRVFQIPLLRAGQLVVEDGQIDLHGLTGEGQLLGLAAADVGGGVGLLAILQHPGDDHRAGGLGQTRQLVQRILAVGGDQHGLFGLFDDAALGDGALYALFGHLDFVHPQLLGNAAGLDRAVEDDGQIVIFHLAQERRAHAGAAAVGHAHGAHGVEPKQPQRLKIHAGEPRVSARMGVNAAKARQPVEISAQVQLRQRDGADAAHGDLQHLAVAAEIDQHLAVDLVGEANQNVQETVGQILIPLKFRVVQLFQLLEHAVADACNIAVNHSSSRKKNEYAKQPSHRKTTGWLSGGTGRSDVLDLLRLLLGLFALFHAILVVLNGGVQGLLGQHGAVHLHRRQSAQRIGNHLVGDLEGLLDGLALDHFGRTAGGGDGRAAAEGLELHVGDDVVFDLDVDFHDVAALGVAHGADAARVLNFAHVAGIHKVIHDLLGIHGVCLLLIDPNLSMCGIRPSAAE